MESSPLGFYQSLLHQLLWQIRLALAKLLPVFLNKRMKYGKEQVQWHLQEVHDYLLETITQPRRHSITLFVDALDECNEEDERCIISFFEKSASLAYSSGVDFKICWSSRHYPHISVERALQIRVDDENAPDIATFVHAKLSPLQPGRSSADLEAMTVQKASGVFLWASLVVQKLVRAADQGKTMKQKLDILDRMPPELGDLFKGILDNIDMADRSDALLLIQWVLFAKRPLTLLELGHALACSSDPPYRSLKSWKISNDFIEDDVKAMEQLIRSRSGGLIEVRHTHEDEDQNISYGESVETAIAQVIHESVRDFFLEQGGLLFLDPSLEGKVIGISHDQLKRACLHYMELEEPRGLSKSTPGDDDDDDDIASPATAADEVHSWLAIGINTSWYHSTFRGISHAFLCYASENWTYQASRADYGGASQAQLMQWAADGGLGHWLLHFKATCFDWDRIPDNVDLLWVACLKNIPSCVFALLECRADPNVEYQLSAWAYGRQKRLGHTFPLLIASREGCRSVVELLLERGADIDAKDTSRYGMTH